VETARKSVRKSRRLSSASDVAPVPRVSSCSRGTSKTGSDTRASLPSTPPTGA